MTDSLDQYRALAGRLDADAVALVPGPNLTRSVGRAFHANERAFLLLIPPEAAPVAVVPSLELGSWKPLGVPGRVFDWADSAGPAAAFAEAARALPLRRVAVEGQVMRVFVHQLLAAANPGLEVVDAEADISGLRAIKSGAEIAALERAVAISEAALRRLLDEVHVGQSERAIERRLLALLFEEGAEGLAFDPIVAAGDNSARPHARARDDYHLARGDALLLDFGAMWGGMCADITRTVFMGEPGEEAREVHAAVLEANALGRRIAAPGLSAHALDDAVSGFLEATPFAGRIRTRTGHGLGREVHEAPWIQRANMQPLAQGHVLTIEPGLYRIGGFGLRIEDDVLITAGGCRSLTTFPRDLTVLEP